MTRINPFRKRDFVFLFFLIFIFGGIVCFFSYRWLVSIEANPTIRYLVPAVFGVFTGLGVILVYNLTKLFLYRKKGVKGYKLRGRIATYFLVTIVLAIIVFSSLMFYLIFLIEATFIEEEKKISELLLSNYKTMFEHYQKNFEENLLLRKDDLINFPIVVKIKNSNLIVFDKLNEKRKIISNTDVSIFFYSLSGKVFYSEKFENYAFIQNDEKYYGEKIPLPLNQAIPSLRNIENDMVKLKKLRGLIFPVSLFSILILAIPLLLTTFYVSVFAAKNITIPVEKILKGTILLTKNLDYRVKVDSKDELEDLAENFNKMAESLKDAYQKIKRIERIEAWKEVAKKLAHEIKNPLTPIRLSTERLILAYEKGSDNFKDILDKTAFTIIEESKKIENLLNEFSKFLRLPPLKLEDGDIVSTIMEVKNFFENAYENICFELELPFENFILTYDKEKIKQVLFNLIKNSIEAIEKERRIIIGCNVFNNFLEVYVRDFGKGIPKEAEEQIFKPYFTTKQGGNGIGLALSERIISEHEGNIGFLNQEKGVKFFFQIPITKEKIFLKGNEDEG